VVIADINIDYATITTSPYWFQEAPIFANQGKILFCAWLQLVDSTGTGVCFYAVEIGVGVDLTGDLPVGGSASIGRNPFTAGTSDVDLVLLPGRPVESSGAGIAAAWSVASAVVIGTGVGVLLM